MKGKSFIIPVTVALFLVALWGLNLGQNVCLVSCSPVDNGGPQVRGFTVREYSYELLPSTIKVNKGDVVEIMFITTNIPHGYILDGYDIKTGIIPVGGHETMQFTADKTGTFYFHDYTNNRNDIGSLGKLIVTG